jgi:hypothetical protein
LNGGVALADIVLEKSESVGLPQMFKLMMRIKSHGRVSKSAAGS